MSIYHFDYHHGLLQVQLQHCPGSNYDDPAGRVWNDFAFHPLAITDSILITVLSVYDILNNGITEVEFYKVPGEWISYIIFTTQ